MRRNGEKRIVQIRVGEALLARFAKAAAKEELRVATWITRAALERIDRDEPRPVALLPSEVSSNARSVFLRFSPLENDLIAEAAYILQISKAEWILDACVTKMLNDRDRRKRIKKGLRGW